MDLFEQGMQRANGLGGPTTWATVQLPTIDASALAASPIFSASGGAGGFVTLAEPPPAGYPRIIVHPERPNAAFALIENGWYRSPTGEVVSYKTVADYVLTAQGVDRATLLKALGQIPAAGWSPSTLLLIGGAVLLSVLLIGRN